MKDEETPQDSKKRFSCSECSSVLVLSEDTGELVVDPTT
jgi:hypothetical protein